MDKTQALNSFWSGFEWPAFDEQGDFDNKTKEDLGITDRYIAYEVQTGDYTMPVALTASLFHRSSAWDTISQKASEIEEELGVGGKKIAIDGGYLWIKKRIPFAQHMADESTPDMRRILINIEADFLTAT